MSFPVTEIGEVASFINGFPFKLEDWEDNGLPIIRIQNLTDPSRPYNFTTRKVAERYRVRKGDVLVSWFPTIDVFEWEDIDALLNQHFFKVEFDNKKIDKQFFKKILKKTIADLSKYAHGCTMKHIVKQDFERHKIPLPLLDDQIRIAHLLSKVERLIIQRKQDLQQLDNLLKSVFLEMFGNPVKNERGWDKVPFSQILTDIESGKSPKCESRKATKNEWAILRLGSVTSCFYKQEENKALLPDVYPDIRWEVKKGDVLFSRKNTYELVAACAYVFETRSKLLLPDLIFRFVFKNITEVQPLFIWGLLTSESQRRQIQSLAAGTSGSMPNISKTNLKQVLLIKPPIDLQNQFAAVVEKIEKIKLCYQEILQDLEQLYDGLSQSAFKGELDLSRVPAVIISEKLQTLPHQPISVKEEKASKDFMPFNSNEIEYVFCPLEDLNELNSAEARLKLVKKWLAASISALDSNRKVLSLSNFIRNAQVKLQELVEFNASIDINLKPFLKEAQNAAEALLEKNTQLIGLFEYDSLKSDLFNQLKQSQFSQYYDSGNKRLKVRIL